MATTNKSSGKNGKFNMNKVFVVPSSWENAQTIKNNKSFDLAKDLTFQ